MALVQFSPDKQVTYCRDESRCYFGTAPSIKLIQEAYGQNTAESWMEIQLRNLSEFAGCKDKLTLEQITELAAMMIEDYPHYKLTEFMLFFQRFKRCEYGKFYGAVDPMVILQALAIFNEERERRIEQRNQTKREEEKKVQDKEDQELRQRYTNRVPDAWTDNAPINFLQYRLMGYDEMTDEQLTAELADLQSGKKTIPQGVTQIFALVKGAFSINE